MAEGRFHDGRTTAAHLVEVTTADGALSFSAGGERFTWSLAELDVETVGDRALPFDDREVVRDALRRVAEAQGCTVAQLAIAWVAAQGHDIVPLVGARTRERLTEALPALDVTLTADERHQLSALIAAGKAAAQKLARARRDGMPSGVVIIPRMRSTAPTPSSWPSVGTLWSATASVRSGRRTWRLAARRPAKAWGEVTSWIRCRSM